MKISNLVISQYKIKIDYNVDNMKWLGFGAANLSHATKLIGSKLAKKSDNTQLFYIMCYVALLL